MSKWFIIAIVIIFILWYFGYLTYNPRGGGGLGSFGLGSGNCKKGDSCRAKWYKGKCVVVQTKEDCEPKNIVPIK